MSIYRSAIICYQLTWYPLFCNQNQLLSASSGIQTFAIKLIYYWLSCDHIHLLSSLICNPASTAIDIFAIKPHFLSGQFAINPQLQSTILLSIIICYQIFDLLSILILTNFSLKIRKKFLKILEFFILWQTLRGHGTGSLCTNLLKDSNNSTCIFTKKT